MQVIGCKKDVLSVTAWPVPAGVAGVFGLLFGLAAAGFTEFFRGRAGFPVADLSFGLFVFLAAGAGMIIDTSPPDGG